MYTIKIKHRGDNEATHYPIYQEREAKERDMAYKHWKDADIGENALTDDNYVACVLSRREYVDNKGRKNVTYTNLTAVLVEALKEQNEQIEDLKERIKKLENE